ncbi:MAG: hypothetical protein QF535_11880 [Anaerolineales bacterium]|nr:hypothetical protein [Anaerolineales bacterium]
MIGVTEALQSLTPKSEWVLRGDVLEWHSADITQPTQSEIDAEVIRLQAEYDSQEYARNRKAEYDQLNQFEMQFDDDRDGTTTWVDTINEIKGRHPK